MTMPDDCILWTGAVSSNGYGNAWHNGHNTSAHRAVWERTFGPIPGGLFVCHACDIPLCINVDHLFLGTSKANTYDMLRKGRGRGNGNEDKTHCEHGHEFTSENTYSYSGKRACVECRRRWAREHYRRAHGLPTNK
jgi:hypothetical protein